MAPVIVKPEQVSVTHSRLSKQSSSVLQPPCRIPQGALGVQHNELKVESLVKKQLSLLSNSQDPPTFLSVASILNETDSKCYENKRVKFCHYIHY